jgi:acetyl-CoA carboxylase biotin carboxylase subunit
VGFHRILIANRGEVAVRVARACDQLGITPVFAASEADKAAPYTKGREVVVLGPGRAAQSYLDPERVVQAAVQAHCTALHPGWGFLSENPLLATLCAQHGVTFIGPPPHVTSMMGSKTRAKAAMRASGLQVIPGSNGVLSGVDEAKRVAGETGFPVLFKAENGGGGRGMRIARSAADVRAAYEEASGEARAAFGDPRVYLEKLIEGGRHVEIQILADRYGNAIHVGERDCSVQRSHQTLIEESPATAVDAGELARTLEAAVRATRSIGYVGAGTMEFLLDEGGTLRFMEMNTRLQVEHSVTEMRTGIDLVAEQIRIGAGHRLALRQEDVRLEGHAIECRINAEDPANGFQPQPGTLAVWEAKAVPGEVRVDTHVEPGYAIPPFYDSLICKVITHGATRDEAADRMIAALTALRCEGVPTTIPMHLEVLGAEAFRTNDYDTRAIPGFTPVGS